MSHGAKAANTLLQKTTVGYPISVGTVHLDTFTSVVTAGSWLNCWIAAEAASGVHTVSVTDDVNGAWTQDDTYVRSATIRFGTWWHFKNSASGTIHVTATSDVPTYMTMAILEYSVPSPTGVTLVGVSSTTGSGTVLQTSSVTVSGSGQLVLCGFGQGNAAVITTSVDSPFTLETNQPTGTVDEGGATADDQNASANEQAVFRVSNSLNAWVAECVSYLTGAVASNPVNFTILPGGTNSMQINKGGTSNFLMGKP